MKPFSWIVIVLLLGYVKTNAQNMTWAAIYHNGGGGPGSVSVDAIKEDAEGCLVVVGGISGTVNIGGKIFNTKTVSKSGSSFFIARLDISGNLLWIRVTDSSAGNSSFAHIEISKKGDYFFSGYNLAPNVGFVGFPKNLMPKENNNGFIGKCDKNGNIKWIRKYLSYAKSPYTSYGGIVNFKIDKNENVYFTEILQDSFHLGYISIQGKKYYVKKTQAFIVSFDSAGSLNWIKFCPENFSNSSLETGSGKYLYTFARSNNKGKYIFEKFDLKGHTVIKKPFDFFITDTIKDDMVLNLKVDDRENIYLIRDSVLNQNNASLYMVKYDSSFQKKWEILSQGFANPDFAGSDINSATGSIFISGHFWQNFSFGGINIDLDANDIYANVFVTKVDSLGRVIWIKNSTAPNHRVPWYSSTLASAQNACDDFYLRLLTSDSYLHFENLNIDYQGNPDWGSLGIIAKFSFDSLGFSIDSNTCEGTYLHNKSIFPSKNFRWYINGKLADSSINFLAKVHRSGRYAITLQGIKSSACAPAFTDTLFLTASPTAGFIVNDSQGCQYINLSFTDTSHADTVNRAVGESWAWDFGDHSPLLIYQGSKPNKITHAYTQNGTYTVKLVYNNGYCADTFVSPQKIHIIPAPKPGFAVSDTFGCLPLNISVTDKSEGEVARWLYRIRPASAKAMAGNGDSSEAPSFTYVFPKTGSYIIHQYITGPTGCITEDSIHIQVRQGVSDTTRPVLLRATYNPENTVDLHWLPVIGTKEYQVYKGGIFLNTTTDTGYNDASGAGTLSPAGGGRGWNPEYRITASDSCTKKTLYSNVARPIRLSGQNIDNQYFLLNWTPYIKWNKDVFHYEIEMKQADGSFANINMLNDTGYHDAEHFSTANLTNCYRIKATELGGNSQVSYSNILCLPYLPQIWVPNAFSPNVDTRNDTFKITTVGIKTYRLAIYNQWGTLLYEKLAGINDQPSVATEGWDGTFHGEQAPEGVYFYILNATSLYNGNFNRSGIITVLR